MKNTEFVIINALQDRFKAINKAKSRGKSAFSEIEKYLFLELSRDEDIRQSALVNSKDNFILDAMPKAESVLLDGYESKGFDESLINYYFTKTSQNRFPTEKILSDLYDRFKAIKKAPKKSVAVSRMTKTKRTIKLYKPPEPTLKNIIYTRVEIEQRRFRDMKAYETDLDDWYRTNWFKQTDEYINVLNLLPSKYRQSYKEYNLEEYARKFIKYHPRQVGSLLLFGGFPFLYLVMLANIDKINFSDDFLPSSPKKWQIDNSHELSRKIVNILQKQYPKDEVKEVVGEFVLTAGSDAGNAGKVKEGSVPCFYHVNPETEEITFLDIGVFPDGDEYVKANAKMCTRALKAAYLIFPTMKLEKVDRNVWEQLEAYLSWIIRCPPIKTFKRLVGREFVDTKTKGSIGVWVAYGNQIMSATLGSPAASYEGISQKVGLDWFGLVCPLMGIGWNWDFKKGIVPQIKKAEKYLNLIILLQQSSYLPIVTQNRTIGDYFSKINQMLLFFNKANEKKTWKSKWSPQDTIDIVVRKSVDPSGRLKAVKKWGGKYYAIHKGMIKPDGTIEEEKLYKITHLPTGLGLYEFELLKDAREVAQTLDAEVPVDRIRQILIDPEGVAFLGPKVPLKLGMSAETDKSLEWTGDLLRPIAKVWGSFYGYDDDEDKKSYRLRRDTKGSARKP